MAVNFFFFGSLTTKSWLVVYVVKSVSSTQSSKHNLSNPYHLERGRSTGSLPPTPYLDFNRCTFNDLTSIPNTLSDFIIFLIERSIFYIRNTWTLRLTIFHYRMGIMSDGSIIWLWVWSIFFFFLCKISWWKSQEFVIKVEIIKANKKSQKKSLPFKEGLYHLVKFPNIRFIYWIYIEEVYMYEF